MPAIDESIQVWVVHLAGQTAESWRPVLTSNEWEKAMRFRFTPDQVRSAVTRGVLKTLLGRYSARPAERLEFTQNQFGKPAVLGGGIEFNVSHSGEYALLGFSKTLPLGVDVEHIRGERVVSDMAQRVLTSNEYMRFMTLPEALRKRTFFEIWTLKESVMKAMGTGMSVAPECIEVTFYPDAPAVIKGGQLALRTLDIGDADYAAALAIEGKEAPLVEIRHFESHIPDNIY